MVLNDYLKQTNTLIVTNGDFYPTSPLITSIKTYESMIDNNFYIIPCSIGNRKIYGLEAFCLMLLYANSFKYDYIIYIDADCFISNLDNLYKVFKQFVESNNIIMGPADGGCFCHRNLNNFAINPFLSFYNIKKISKFIKDNKFKLTNKFFIENISERTKFNNKLVIDAINLYNKSHIINNKHAKLISMENNGFESLFGSNQKPFTTNYLTIVDPYYYLFFIFLNAGEDFSYFFGRDYIFEADDSGISSALFSDEKMDDDSLICIHTWFSRCAEMKYAISKQEPYFTQFKRIKNIEKYFGGGGDQLDATGNHV